MRVIGACCDCCFQRNETKLTFEIRRCNKIHHTFEGNKMSSCSAVQYAGDALRANRFSLCAACNQRSKSSSDASPCLARPAVRCPWMPCLTKPWDDIFTGFSESQKSFLGTMCRLLSIHHCQILLVPRWENLQNTKITF